MTFKEKYYHYRHILYWKIGHYKSVWRRDETIRRYISHHTVRKLQVACGPYELPGWLNTELFGSPTLVPLNLLKPFPIPDKSFHYIFSEHTHEHFTLEQGQQMLQEFFRILKPGGKIRISTPDLRFLIELYTPKSQLQKRYLSWSSHLFLPTVAKPQEAHVINTFVRSWGHQFIYDYKTLKQELARAGFIDIKKAKVGKSTDKHLKGIEHHGNSTGEEFNQLESLVVEAVKPRKK